MLLFVVGPVDATKVMEQIKENQAKKNYSKVQEIKRQFENEPLEVAKKKQVLPMNVQTSKCLVGIKAKHVEQSGAEMLKHELTISIIFDLLFGKSSKNYRELYSEGIN